MLASRESPNVDKWKEWQSPGGRSEERFVNAQGGLEVGTLFPTASIRQVAAWEFLLLSKHITR